MLMKILSIWLHGSGWGPDYADPYTYLSTMKTNGDMSGYTGSGRLAKANDELKGTDMIKQSFEDYSNAVEKIDSEVLDTTQRYTEFAEQEYNLLYKDFLSNAILYQRSI